MSKAEKEEKRVARREFLKGAAVGVAGVAAGGVLAGCGSGATPAPASTPQIAKETVEVTKEVEAKPWLPEKWDHEADVVVLGYGGAGAVAAITAADVGAKVLILEKEPADTADKINHTPSTRLCYSAMMSFHSKEEAITYLKACSRGATPEDVIEAWAEYAISTKDWIESMGGTLTDSGDKRSEYPDTIVPGAYSYNMFVHENNGEGLWETLSNAVDERKVEVLYETPAARLIVDGEGQVIGAVAQQGGKEIYVKASRGVVLTTGGFEYDDDMLNNFVYGYPSKFYANPGNTGDGIKMAQAVGAALWHMVPIGGRVIPFFPDLGFGVQGGTPSPFVLVDKYGKRFMKESWKSHSAVWESMKFNTDLGEFPAIPCFSVFDQSALDKGPVVNGGMLSVGAYNWSQDNSVEVEKGWILKGDTIEDLANVIAQDPDAAGKMTPEALADTLARYNGYCDGKADPDFGRSEATLLKLETPPFYAVKMYPGGVNTFGGPRRNAKGQIVKPDNQPVDRLYGGGEMGSILGFLYAGGGWNVCELVVSGQIAGKNAAAESPWDQA